MNNRRCGLYCHPVGSEWKPLHLTRVDIDVEILELVGQVTITQEYFNSEEQSVEAIYEFPLDEKASVCEFKAIIEDRSIFGVVKEKQEARNEYNKAIQQGQTAALMEQDKPDIFQMKVGNIPTATPVYIIITYVTELINDGDKVRLLIPTTVAPRYTPASTFSYFSQEPKPFTSLHPKKRRVEPYYLSISLECLMASPILSISSPTHSISSTTNEKQGHANLILDSSINGDILIDVQISAPHQPRYMIEEGEKGAAGMIVIVPEFHLDEIQGEFVFIIDRSGSMEGTKIRNAQTALELFIRSLPTNSYFNIVSFGDKYNMLFPKSVQYNNESLKKASQYISSINADMGGTELLQPLKAVFSSKTTPGYPRQVFVLTDGQVSNTEEVINLVQRNSDSSRVFSLGIGSGVSHHLVEGMARAGKGTCEYVVDGQPMESTIIKQLKNAVQPSLQNVRVDWGVEENSSLSIPKLFSATIGSLIGHRANEKSQKLFQAPFKAPPIFDGTKLIIYCLFPPEIAPKPAKIIAESPDGPLSLELHPEKSIFHGSQIHKLAARALIRDLEEGRSYLHLQPNNYIPKRSSPGEIQQEIIRLGTTFQLVSKYTSFVAVDKEKRLLFIEQYVEPPQEILESNAFISPKKKSRGMTFPLPQVRRSSTSAKKKNSHANQMRSSPAPSSVMDSFSIKEEMRMEKEEEEDDDMEVDEMAPPPGVLPFFRIPQQEQSNFQAILIPKEEEKKREMKKSKKLIDLVSQQNFDGSFDLTDQFSAFVEISMQDMKAFANQEGIEPVVATCIAVSYMELVFASQKDEWEMVIRKSKKYLDTQLKNVGKDLNQILIATLNFLKSHIN